MASKKQPAMQMRTGTMSAWMRDTMGPQDLETDACVSRLTYLREGPDSDESYWLGQGYTKVGRATITVEILDEKGIVGAKVQSLKAELQKTRADAEVKCNRLIDQIGKLEALEWNGVAA